MEIPKDSATNAKGQIQARIQWDNIEDPRYQKERLEQEVQRLQSELEKTKLIDAPQAGRNSLMPTMEFLQEQNKELMKQHQELHREMEQE